MTKSQIHENLKSHNSKNCDSETKFSYYGLNKKKKHIPMKKKACKVHLQISIMCKLNSYK